MTANRYARRKALMEHHTVEFMIKAMNHPDSGPVKQAMAAMHAPTWDKARTLINWWIDKKREVPTPRDTL